MEKKDKQRNGYNYTRTWFDYVMDNSAKIQSSHIALYLWLVEINNKLGWRKQFQITSIQCMQGMCCRSYNTYKKCLDDLVEWGFVEIVVPSKNQFMCNVIALSNFDKALDKALDEQVTKQMTSKYQSTCDIHKTINNKTKNNKTIKPVKRVVSELQHAINEDIDIKDGSQQWVDCLNEVYREFKAINTNGYNKPELMFECEKFLNHNMAIGWAIGKGNRICRDWTRLIPKWYSRIEEYNEQ